MSTLSESLPEVKNRSRWDAQADRTRHPAVFLHCGWRSRGTWIWSRFRANQDVCAFYEPLSEALSSVRLETLATYNADNWESGHRGLRRPYFSEYRPLLRPGRRGVAGYDDRFVTERCFAPTQAAEPQLKAYLQRLLQLAESDGKQAVLKFCRSLGRIGWMQHNFPDAVHVVVLRNPLTQFESARRQLVLHGNAYFLAWPLLLLALHQDVPSVRACCRALDIALPSVGQRRSIETNLSICESHLRRDTPAAWYRSFLAFWLLTTGIPDAVDLVVDSDLMTHSGRYREECAAALTKLTGQAVAFDDEPRADTLYRPDGCQPGFADIATAHAAAEAFLERAADMAGHTSAGLDRCSRMLAEAKLRALSATAAQDMAYDVRAGVPAWDNDATLQAAVRRAVRAEQKLAEVMASRSWKLTAPLRWLNLRLPAALTLPYTTATEPPPAPMPAAWPRQPRPGSGVTPQTRKLEAVAHLPDV